METCVYCGSELRGTFCSKCGIKNTGATKHGMIALQSMYYLACIIGGLILAAFVLYSVGVI